MQQSFFWAALDSGGALGTAFELMARVDGTVWEKTFGVKRHFVMPRAATTVCHFAGRLRRASNTLPSLIRQTGAACSLVCSSRERLPSLSCAIHDGPAASSSRSMRALARPGVACGPSTT
jgi:hypothetical protein